MKLLSIIFAALLVTFSSLAQAVDGLVTLKSPHGVAATICFIHLPSEFIGTVSVFC